MTKLILISILALTVYMPIVPKNACVGEDLGDLSGSHAAWQPLTVVIDGPPANEADLSPNPFLDYRMTVTLYSPSGTTYIVPGYFVGGDQWNAKFAPDAPGTWRYCVSLRSGVNIAISDASGQAATGDRQHGTITVSAPDMTAPGFLAKGRADYVQLHYLRHQDVTTGSREELIALRIFSGTLVSITPTTRVASFQISYIDTPLISRIGAQATQTG